METDIQLNNLVAWVDISTSTDHQAALGDLNELLDRWAGGVSRQVFCRAIQYAYRQINPVQAEINLLVDRWMEIQFELDRNVINNAQLLLPVVQGTQQRLQMPDVPMENIFWLVGVDERELARRLAGLAVALQIRRLVRAEVQRQMVTSTARLRQAVQAMDAQRQAQAQAQAHAQAQAQAQRQAPFAMPPDEMHPQGSDGGDTRQFERSNAPTPSMGGAAGSDEEAGVKAEEA